MDTLAIAVAGVAMVAAHEPSFVEVPIRRSITVQWSKCRDWDPLITVPLNLVDNLAHPRGGTLIDPLEV